MSPGQFLIFLVGVMAMIVAVAAWHDFHRRAMLRSLSRQWDMHMAAGDRLRLANRIAGKVPVVGAANVRVHDLLFSTDGHVHLYLFTIEYGVGVVRGKTGCRQVAGFQEPVSRGGAGPVDFTLTLAPRHLAAAEAYRYVHDALARPPAQP